jgi:hypothetical protein
VYLPSGASPINCCSGKRREERERKDGDGDGTDDAVEPRNLGHLYLHKAYRTSPSLTLRAEGTGGDISGFLGIPVSGDLHFDGVYGVMGPCPGEDHNSAPSPTTGIHASSRRRVRGRPLARFKLVLKEREEKKSLRDAVKRRMPLCSEK